MNKILNDKYKIIKKIAKGGQGEVFLAQSINDELGFKRNVAIKFFLKNNHVKAYFLNEIKNLSVLHHPNICQIIDVGETDENYYLVLEYVEGLNLKEFQSKIREKNLKLNPSAVAEIGLQILHALKYAHSNKSGKILHGDISPHNIVLTSECTAKLVDYGISKIGDQEDGNDFSGKPNYLPKAIIHASQKYSETTEYYSLGVVLFELITGEKSHGQDTIDLSLITNAGLRKLLQTLIDFDSEHDYELVESGFKKLSIESSNLSEVVSRAFDNKFISEDTIVSYWPTSSISKKKSNFKIWGSALFLLIVVCGAVLYSLQRQLTLNKIQILKDGKTEELKVPISFIHDKPEDTINFDTDSCEMFCLQASFYLTMGHKQAYDYNKAHSLLLEDFKDNYEKYLNHSLLTYKKAATSLYNNLNRCELKQTCKYAKEITRIMSQTASLNIDGATQKFEYDKLMKGADPIYNGIVNTVLLHLTIPESVSKTYPMGHRFIDFANQYTVYQTSGILDESVCRKIGDWDFLFKTIDITNPTEANVNSNSSVLVFNTDLKTLKANDVTIIDVGNVNNGKNVKVCLYSRVSGLLKEIKIWNL